MHTIWQVGSVLAEPQNQLEIPEVLLYTAFIRFNVGISESTAVHVQIDDHISLY